MSIRHRVRRRVRTRGLTPRRLAAARRALARQRERYALFAEQLELKSPEERVSNADLALLKQDQIRRDLAAKHWKWGRRMLAVQQPDVALQIVERWNWSWIPPDSAYFADFVRRELRKRGLELEDSE